MDEAALFEELKAEFKRKKFAAGLLVAEVDLMLALDTPSLHASSFDDVLALFPKRDVTASGSTAKTLIVDFEEGTLSLRKFYNMVEHYFRVENQRYDYPSCPGHATGSWEQYRRWLDALATFDKASLEALRRKVIDFVLAELPSQAFDPESVTRAPPLFQYVLEEFDLTSRRSEPTGAAYQAITFGFIRADNPHLQLETRKVRTGSKRRGGIGDIDGWDGGRLATSAEVKQYQVKEEDVSTFEPFAAEVNRRGAIGLVVSLGFVGQAASKIADLGLHPLDRDGMLGIVKLWDPLKQNVAIASTSYHLERIERNSNLFERFDAFLEGKTEEHADSKHSTDE
ncbi:hypothetical protein ACNHKD_13745 [Methylocystis sp. JAN1]|uniref:hypothetical protein n=1 Tax=Methylocystis sp. JAN1 TaxID=3397211 RepID=UPI003FA33E7E